MRLIPYNKLIMHYKISCNCLLVDGVRSPSYFWDENKGDFQVKCELINAAIKKAHRKEMFIRGKYI